MSTREIARRLDRDVHAVHNDVHNLINCGPLRKSDHGIAFPFDAVRLDVTFTSADPVTPPRRRRRRDPEAA